MPKYKRLTKKQEKFINLVGVERVDPVDAVMSSYDCSSRNSARVLLNRLLNNEKVNNRLIEVRQKLTDKIINKEAKFISILKELAPPTKVAERLAGLIFEGDARVADSAIEKYLKLSAEYPDAKSSITLTLEKEREKVLTEADIKKLVEKKKLEEEREKLLELEEGEVNRDN